MSSKNNQKPKRHARDVFHAYMLDGATYSGPLDMPNLKPVHVIPEKLISFNDAMHSKNPDYGCFVHGYEDDKYIEPYWTDPIKYQNKLSKFAGLIGFDYSTCPDFPVPLKQYNHYRNSCMTWWQSHSRGSIVIPNVRCEVGDYENILAGHPKNSVIAIGARGCIRRLGDRARFMASLKRAVDFLHPAAIVWYGSDEYGVADYPRSVGIPVIVFEGKGRGRLINGKVAD